MLGEFLARFDSVVYFVGELFEGVNCGLELGSCSNVTMHFLSVPRRALESDCLFELMHGDLGGDFGERYIPFGDAFDLWMDFPHLP